MWPSCIYTGKQLVTSVILWWIHRSPLGLFLQPCPASIGYPILLKIKILSKQLQLFSKLILGHCFQLVSNASSKTGDQQHLVLSHWHSHTVACQTASFQLFWSHLYNLVFLVYSKHSYAGKLAVMEVISLAWNIKILVSKKFTVQQLNSA